MYNDVLIVFVFDYGDMMGDYYYWRKIYLYEGFIYVLYIVKWFFVNYVILGKIDVFVELCDIFFIFFDVVDVIIFIDMDGCFLLLFVKGMEINWCKYLDLEYVICYSDDNYWCVLIDGKIKYIWCIYIGIEELFDLI